MAPIVLGIGIGYAVCGIRARNRNSFVYKHLRRCILGAVVRLPLGPRWCSAGQGRMNSYSSGKLGKGIDTATQGVYDALLERWNRANEERNCGRVPRLPGIRQACTAPPGLVSRRPMRPLSWG
jgi:hypothetical protein